MNLAPIRKLIVALVGAVATAVSLGLAPDEVGDWLAVAIAFLSALGVYQVRNEPRPGEPSEQGQANLAAVAWVLVIIFLVVLLARVL